MSLHPGWEVGLHMHGWLPAQDGEKHDSWSRYTLEVILPAHFGRHCTFGYVS